MTCIRKPDHSNRATVFLGLFAIVVLVAGCGSGSSGNRPAALSTVPSGPASSTVAERRTEPVETTTSPSDSPTPDTPEAPITSEPVESSEPPESSEPAESTEPVDETTAPGTVSGVSFSRTATLRIVPTIASIGTTNGVNPVDVCLISGNPAGRPAVGAIWLVSNSGCLPGASAADIDLGVVSVAGSSVTYQPDVRVSATGGSLFTSSDNYIFACPFFPVAGAFRLHVGSGGNVSGTIDINGYGGANCGTTRYQARVSG